MPVLLVALGGALGAVARYLVGVTFARQFGTGWPWGTLFINLSGSFLVSVLSVRLTNDNLRYLLPVGFVGAYTTFSTFELETMRLFQSEQPGAAFAYVAVSNLLGLCAVWLGASAATR
jgi:CrcB protein